MMDETGAGHSASITNAGAADRARRPAPAGPALPGGAAVAVRPHCGAGGRRRHSTTEWRRTASRQRTTAAAAESPVPHWRPAGWAGRPALLPNPTQRTGAHAQTADDAH